jgi:hypothetical protein
MKKNIILLIFAYSISIHSYTQNPNYCIPTQSTIDGTASPCCNGNINTDYNYPFNPERSDLLNQFNWLLDNSSINGQASLKINRNNSIISIDHPFLNDIASRYHWFSNYRIGNQTPFLSNNMHPKFGWQLLYYNFGTNLFTNNPASNVPTMYNPVMIFYNKYDGKMRVFASPGNGNSFDKSSVKIDFVSGSGLNYTGIFNHNSEIAKALDKKTEIPQITSNIPFANVNTWSAGDIQTAYDPCICKNESRLQFNFFDHDFSSVYMSGNIVGINRPLDNSGASPLKFGENFLSSVYVNYQNSTTSKAKPLSGMLIYNNVDQIVAGAYVSQNMKNLAGALDILKGPLSDVPDLSGLPIGKAIGFGLSYASKQLNPSTPQITFLEAQGAFQGEINNISNSGGYSSFEILTPGSFHNYRQSIPWTQQPLYNEALGVFGLLETPKVTFTMFPTSSIGVPFDNKYKGLAVMLNDPIKFAINPASDIDVEKSKLYGAIEFDLYDDYGQPTLVNDLNNNLKSAKDYFKPDFVQLSPDTPRVNIDTNFTLANFPTKKRIFSTAILPLSKLSEVYFFKQFNGGTFENVEGSTVFHQPKFRLRIYANYVFKPNQYGEVNNTVQTYLYELTNEKEPNVQINGFPASTPNSKFNLKPSLASKLPSNNLTTLNSTTYYSDEDIYVENLIIQGDLNTISGVNINIYYSGSVTITANSTISPNIHIKHYNSFLSHPNSIELPSENYLKTYCASKYKANQLKNQAIQKISALNTELFQISLYPNPTNSNTTLNLIGYENSNVNVKIFDIIGKEVFNQLIKDISSNEYKTTLNTKELLAGSYIVKVLNGKEEKITKLIIIKN